MSAETQLFAPAFRQRKMGGLFAAIVAVTVYIASLAMAGEAALSSVTLAWNEGIAGRMTAEIPAAADESSTPQAERVKQALSVLRGMPGVTNVAVVPEAETVKLLKPWIADADLVKKLPLPVLIDISLNPGAAPKAAEMEGRLKAAVSDARIDDHAAWLADLSRFIRSLALVAGFMVLLTALMLIAAMSLVCRAVMATERETIELLHVMGANDGDIAGHFEHHARRLAAPASFLGFALALLSMAALLFFLRDVIDPGSLGLSRWLGLLLPVLLVPFAAIAAASVAARFFVTRLLRPAA